MSDEPFGRQPKPVKVTLEGEQVDIDYWRNHLMRAAEFKGDTAMYFNRNIFMIYPRAVND